MSDKPIYANLQSPYPITNFVQQKFGMIEVDACGRSSMIMHGDMLIDGGIKSNVSLAAASLLFNGPQLAISASQLSLSASILNVSGLSVAYAQSASSTSLAPAFALPRGFSGNLYLTPIQNASAQVMYVLCMN
uniref:Uncharacterized protein n=1 Tax=viral metagenome TaxID=1070528 RepID=A0A6C0CQU8_9ZZZZ